jgi:hypothetical protein
MLNRRDFMGNGIKGMEFIEREIVYHVEEVIKFPERLCYKIK